MIVYDLSNLTITELSDILIGRQLKNDATILVSQKEDKSGKIISYRTDLSDLQNNLSTTLGIHGIHTRIDDIYKYYLCNLSDVVYASVQIGNPYILSSITEKNGKLLSVGGYRLSSAMDYVFSHTEFDVVSARVVHSNDIYAENAHVTNANLSNINSPCAMPCTTDNPLASKSFVNSSIEHVAAYYITKKEGEQHRAFRTYEELSSTALSDIYCGVDIYGTERQYPTRNDYCVVLSDEVNARVTTGLSANGTTRYMFNRVSCDQDSYGISCWSFQYIVNSTPFTDAQWTTLNCGITKIQTQSLGTQDSVVPSEKLVKLSVDNILERITAIKQSIDSANQTLDQIV